MAYTPVKERQKTSSGSGGYVPVSQRQVTPKLTVVTAKPQAVLKVVDKPISTPNNLQGGTIPQTTVPVQDFTPKQKPVVPTVIPAKTKNLPSLPNLPKITVSDLKVVTRPVSNKNYNDVQKTSSVNDLQPSSNSSGYIPVDMRVTGVNGTEPPAPTRPLTVGERLALSIKALPHQAVSDFMAGVSNAGEIINFGLTPFKKYFEKASTVGPNSSGLEKIAFAPGAVIGGLAMGLKSISTKIAQDTGLNSFWNGFIADPEKQIEILKSDPHTFRDVLLLFGAFAGVDTGIGGIDDLANVPKEVKEFNKALKEAENADDFLRMAKTIGLEKLGVKSEQEVKDIFLTYREANQIKVADPLIQEARKYKSAEEFVKAQGEEPAYHGTNYSNARTIQAEGLNPEKATSIKDGNQYTFITQDEKYAKSYATQKGGSSGSFVLGFKKPGDAIVEANTYKKGMKFPDLVSKEHIKPEDIYIKGIDNKWYPIKEFNFFMGEPDSFVGKNGFKELPIKTKSQLTDIWNKANKVPEIKLSASSKTAKQIKESIAPTAEKITRAEDVLLRQRIRDEARGAKIGFKEGRVITKEALLTKFRQSETEIKDLQTNIIKYVKDKLPTAEQSKFIPAIQGATTKKQQISIFSRVDRLAENLERKELIGEIKEFKKPSVNIAVDYQKKISEITSGLDFAKPTQETTLRLKKLSAFLAENQDIMQLHPELVAKIERLSKIPLAEMTTEDLRELKNNLNHLEDLGKLKLALTNKYNTRVREANVKRLIESTVNQDTASEKGAEVKRIYMNTLHTPRVGDMIDGFMGYGGENSAIIKRIGQAETDAKDMTKGIIGNALEEIKSAGIEELTDEQMQRIMINIRKQEGASDQVGVLLKKYNFNAVPSIDSKEQQIIDIIKKYTNQHTDQIATIYEEITNTPFKKLDNYILPIKYEDEFNIVPEETITQGRFRTTKTEQGFTQSRKKGVDKVPRIDLLGIFEEAVNDQQWYLHLQPELENTKYIVLHPDYQKHAGEIVTAFWKDYLDSVARRGWSATAKANPLLRQARVNLNQAVLGYKVTSVIMQPMAVFDAMAYAQSRYGGVAALDVMSEFLRNWIIPGRTKKMLSESSALRVRAGGEVAIADELNKLSGNKSLWDAYRNNALKLLQKGDLKTASGVQAGLEKILLKHGIPDAQKEAEFLMNLTQGSAEVAYRPLVLSKGEGARTWFTFQTFALNRWGIVAHDLINSGLIHSKGWQNKLNAIVGLGILTAGIVAEQEARSKIREVLSGKDNNKDSLLREVVTALPSQIPYFGNIISVGNSDPAVMTNVENTYKGFETAITGKKTNTKIRGVIRAGAGIASVGFGVPGTTQASELLQRLFPDEVGNSSNDGLSGGLPSLPELPQLPTLPNMTP